MPQPFQQSRPRQASRNRVRWPGSALAATLVATMAAAQSSPTLQTAGQSLLTLDEALREIATHSSATVTSRLDLGAATESTRRAEAR